LRRLPPKGKVQLRRDAHWSPEVRGVAHAVVRNLFPSRKYLRSLPVTLQVKFDLPGGGLRSGGCFPMRQTPAGLETDIWGCLPNLLDVHLVDSSVLPSIPAGPLAFTVMSYAHRFASVCPINYV